MDVKEFDNRGETLLIGAFSEAHEGSSSAADEETHFHDELRRLRLELERLEAFQRTLESETEDPDYTPEDEAQADGSESITDTHQPRERKYVRLFFIAAVVVILLVIGSALWSYLQSYQSTDDAQVDGYLDPISSRINGTISSVYVDNNQWVKAGQLLIQLDPRDFQIAVEQAQAQLA
jgi:biotin/lipoyl-binding protein